MATTLVLGGARSGKSALAVEMGHRHDGPVRYIATAPLPVGGQRSDADMAARIARHRAERPDGWTTVEEELDLGSALDAPPGTMVIVDCLTLWTSNLMERDNTDAEIERLAADAAAVAGDRSDPVVVISNEVGLGVHPATELGRRYRDVLGRVNQHWAAAATTTLFLVAGRALPLVDPWTLLERNDRDEAPDATGMIS